MTPRQILLKHYKSQSAIARDAGITRQAMSQQFQRGRLSYEVASVLSRKLNVPISALLYEWHPNTNRPAAMRAFTRRRLRSAEPWRE